MTSSSVVPDDDLVARAQLRPDDTTGALVPEVDGETPGSPVSRVAATPEAVAMLRRLAEQHGPLMVHQSGGCCDGSSPMCYPRGDFLIGDADVLLGFLDEDVPVFIGGRQFPLWSHTHLTVDLVNGRERVQPGGARGLSLPRPLAPLHRRRGAGAGGGRAPAPRSLVLTHKPTPTGARP